ncbi:MAG: hypothetical protein OQJ96_06110 [Flavobacteriales bacterium]|nr:hypothetical protein [Flavobacteriales bacterium]MCW8937652.1 hypothetical protein [Flavobacteriales bacterium]MCW8967586.1 hypothetical protein [Flavobacteriales bacterium]MCW8990140.1 hypothetical protein [Flavobacteriales bacterium]MCW9019858.1 hypothetical protein [Flavobacteriales bacterium]
MNNLYQNKAEICYNDVCAKFYNENASIITAVVAFAILMFVALAIARILS